MSRHADHRWKNDSLEYVRGKIARMAKVESAEVTDLGTIKVVITGHDRVIREEVLEIGKRAMMPIQVFFKLADGNVVGEDKPKTEWVNDYYKTIKVPGFAEPSDAPPEEVAAEVDGALKLRRVRSKTRGRPVVAWRMGDDELRVGSRIEFKKETPLQWTMGRTITIAPGATAIVSELSSRRPMAFIRIGGEYDNIELPIQMMGHLFNLVHDAQRAKAELGEAKQGKKSKLTPDMNRLMHSVGWGRNQDTDNVPANQPFDRDQYITRDGEPMDDDREYEEVVTLEELDLDA